MGVFALCCGRFSHYGQAPSPMLLVDEETVDSGFLNQYAALLLAT